MGVIVEHLVHKEYALSTGCTLMWIGSFSWEQGAQICYNTSLTLILWHAYLSIIHKSMDQTSCNLTSNPMICFMFLRVECAQINQIFCGTDYTMQLYNKCVFKDKNYCRCMKDVLLMNLKCFTGEIHLFYIFFIRSS